jgi:hypothetical protein
MFINLPEPIQQQILLYLETDNFPAAKALHDRFAQNLYHDDLPLETKLEEE